ncbi:MAG: hypothetical protein BAJALOKI2v1_100051 [Promethearchaeota archaeon]|nr:MAG: hypothetical protein BAJALOKI2v1_100051 [Candidatus Lokiarchaeota archaeon]
MVNGRHFNKKICLLGCLEELKNEFQEKISQSCLPFENKRNIGVNISRIEFSYEKDVMFNYFLWNINCQRRKAFLRTTFYPGAEAIIIFISENKVEQIYQYLNELNLRMPMITVLFCVIIKNHTIKEIVDAYFQNSEFQSIFREYDFKFRYIKNLEKILNEISKSLLSNINPQRTQDNCFINFVPQKKLTNKDITQEGCQDYSEPDSMVLVDNKRINIGKLKEYLGKLDINIDEKHPEWIKVENKDLGTFSICLKNGNVYFNSKMYDGGRKRGKKESNTSLHYLCIEAKNYGWSNVKGFSQNEMLILSKILALKEATRQTLPESITTQIDKIVNCF